MSGILTADEIAFLKKIEDTSNRYRHQYFAIIKNISEYSGNSKMTIHNLIKHKIKNFQK